jgi:hypothetical protein
MAQVSANSNTRNVSADDLSLINELYTTIEDDPTAIYPRKFLVEQLTACGWISAAVDAAKDVLKLDPKDKEMLGFVEKHQTTAPASPTKSENRTLNKLLPRFKTKYKAETVPVPTTDGERGWLEKRLIDAITTLQERAGMLSRDMRVVTEVRKGRGESISRDDELDALKSLANGQLGTFNSQNPHSARAIARDIETENDPQKAIGLAISDLEDILDRLRSSDNPPNDDSIREILSKRCRIIATSLSAEKQDQVNLALMHLEHEKLGRKYHNSETMFGDEVKDIHRSDFLMSEDGYAWSMDELAQAITAGGGVMRNPLSKEMFSTTDIKRIIQHPTGNKLAVMQLEQSKLSKGVRSTTIDQLSKLADVFLTDMEDDQRASRLALGVSYQGLGSIKAILIFV